MSTTPSATVAGPHGGDGRYVAAALGLDPSTIIDLSASLNPFAPDIVGTVRTVIEREPHAITSYPDPAAATRALAGAIDVDADRLVLTNGGAESIALVAAIEERGSVVAPEFSLYERHLATVTDGAPRWRSNPSNPLGQLATPGESARVWDEAFYPLATGTWTRGDDTAWRLGSLTKLWACPGLRIGYLIAPSTSAAAEVRCRQPQWSVNGLALAVLPRLLATTELDQWTASIVELREQFASDLRGHGFQVRTTTANWLLIDHPSDLRLSLARHGVIVRDCTSFGLHDTFRVALPRPQLFDRVVEAFAAVAQEL